MKNGKLGLKYEVYIAVPTERVWEALTEGSATKQYFYRCSVRSTFKKGAPISYLGEHARWRSVGGEDTEAPHDYFSGALG